MNALTSEARHTLTVFRVCLPYDMGAVVDTDAQGRPIVIAAPAWGRMAPLVRVLCARGLHFHFEEGSNGDPLVIVQA